MKLAVLILAHKNVHQVTRLIESLRASDVDIFLHADKKWELNEQEIALLRQQCYMIETRISCALDSAELVDAELELLRTATQHGNYQYFCLISGQDYPLYSIQEILRKLERCYPEPILDVTPYAQGNWVWMKFNASSWYKSKNSALNQRYMGKKSTVKKLKKLGYLLWDICVIQRFNTLARKLKRMGMGIYGGSAWWILPDTIVKKILAMQQENTEFCNLLRDAFTPEETFFQTMVMNSDFAEKISVNSHRESKRHCATFIDFGGNERPVVAHPYVFTMQDLPSLCQARNEGYLFARKFDENIDGEILNYLCSQNGKI